MRSTVNHVAKLLQWASIHSRRTKTVNELKSLFTYFSAKMSKCPSEKDLWRHKARMILYSILILKIYIFHKERPKTIIWQKSISIVLVSAKDALTLKLTKCVHIVKLETNSSSTFPQTIKRTWPQRPSSYRPFTGGVHNKKWQLKTAPGMCLSRNNLMSALDNQQTSLWTALTTYCLWKDAIQQFPSGTCWQEGMSVMSEIIV